MDKKRHHITKRILDLTLEIIHLLTGEDYVPLKKSGDHVTPSNRRVASRQWSKSQSFIIEPPLPSLIPENFNAKKILQLTSKIIELLTKEELDYLEEDTNFYKDKFISIRGQYMMEDHQTLTSPDGSRNPPERCPRPLYSRDSTQEGQKLSENSTEIPRDDLDNQKAEDVEAVIITQIHTGQELYVRGDDPCKEEESPTEIITGAYENSPEHHPVFSHSLDTNENVAKDIRGHPAHGHFCSKSDSFPVSEHNSYFSSSPDLMAPGISRGGDQVFL
ncbi:uncharacterized protein [Pyxicephalus adspersus]|uniref:uncharacterized protein n=1 Tax=Pyxicephalus adspersus TaxID=30357 RepID=UPI003B5B2A4E